MKIISKVRDYNLDFIHGILGRKSLASGMTGRKDKRFFLVDKNIQRIYRRKLSSFIGKDHLIIVPALETSKTLPYLIKIYKNLLDCGITRKDSIITLGGGILQDVSGFVASTLYRGVKWIFIPTTLLSQADSCIGSKTSLNFGRGKNQLGTFYPPDQIFIDPQFNSTLPANYFNSGIGEIIKVHLMAGEREFNALKIFSSQKDIRKTGALEKLIRKSLEIKKSFFEADEFDKGRRNLLNYGHTFGHALESASDFSIGHGEAVMIGIGFANAVSFYRNIMRRGIYEEISRFLELFYPDFALSPIQGKKLLEFIKKDKKRANSNNSMILLRYPGQLRKYDDITDREILHVYNKFKEYFNSTGSR